MNLKILLPFRIFDQQTEVKRIVAETANGSFGILPQRLDCVAALVPSILVYETSTDGEIYVAVDDGLLVKIGREVLISVRRAIRGADLTQLRASVEKEFLTLSESEQAVRETMTKLEFGLMRRLANFHHE